ncbi:CHASE4 domain-containing protein [Vibrio galatheae]|uniref:CHASE4 domain-containing protein n=1 Tax=Vibrio galatheae TaxID=579748 RepID=UPI000B003734|nr:CHASE4 domain-containing protein [Vibrio galatheae]
MTSPRLLNFNLQTRTAIYFTIGMLGIAFSCIFITRYFFLTSLDSLESMESQSASQQASSVVTLMVTQMEERSYDWAYWDETFELLTGGDKQAYRDRNLSPDSLDVLGLDMMIFADLHGKVIESIVRSPDDEPVDIDAVVKADVVTRHIQQMNGLLDSQRCSASGLLVVGQQVWAISLTP